MYSIVVCLKCRRLLVADSTKKSRKCVYCGTKIWLNKAKVIYHVETAREATEIIQHLKKNQR